MTTKPADMHATQTAATNTIRLHRVLKAPPEACYLGWQESLTLLAKLVEAEIPDYSMTGKP